MEEMLVALRIAGKTVCVPFWRREGEIAASPVWPKSRASPPATIVRHAGFSLAHPILTACGAYSQQFASMRLNG